MGKMSRTKGRDGMLFCACGCGERIPAVNKKGVGARFKHGHNGRQFLFSVEDRGYTTPCWVFSNGGSGYGRIKRNGKNYQAHRLSYEREHGPIPDGLELDHLCGVKRCVNPAHLEPVTQAENCRRKANTKLTHQQVREIREAAAVELARREAQGFKRRSTGWQDEMAARYGVTRDTIKQVVRRTIWAEA